MKHFLTEQQVDSFRLNGFLVVEDVLTDDEVAILATRTDLIASGKATHVPNTSIQLEPVFRTGERQIENQVMSVRKLYTLAVHDDVMWSFATHAKIVDIVADLLETDHIKMYTDQLFMKSPETGSEQPWHQDSASWLDLFPMDLVSAWIAIDEATTENGCLNFAVGTHRCGMMNKRQIQTQVSQLGQEPWPIVPVPLKPGSISFHHSLVLHRSGANVSKQRRRGYAVHYMRATTIKDESVKGAPKLPPFRQVRGHSFSGCV